MTVTASLVVELGDAGAESGLLQAEVDSRPDGLNAGGTQFIPGDDVYYLVYTGQGTVLTSQVSTLGSISAHGSASRQVTEVVTFANQRSATLGYPVQSGLDVDWMGNSPGVAQLRKDNELVLPARGVGVATVTYTTRFDIYRLSNLPGVVNGKSDYTVLIVLFGEAG